MSWDCLGSEVAEMFAEYSGPYFDLQIEALCERHAFVSAAAREFRNPAAEAAARRVRYATDPEFARHCREVARQWVRANADHVREQRRRRYDQLVNAGDCCSCSKPLLSRERRRCSACANANAAAASERRERARLAKTAAGIGTVCGVCGRRGHNRRGCGAVSA